MKATFAKALRHYEEIMGYPISTIPRLELVESSTFWAQIEPEGEGYLLQVTRGLMDQVRQLWQDAFADPEFLAGVGTPVQSDPDRMTEISLIWLMLHELHHIELNHFDLSTSVRITETRNAPGFGLSRRDPVKADPLAGLPAQHRADAPLCLELQADHDAAEMLIEAYSVDEWQSLRHRTMAIAAVMMLVEREDARHGALGKSHPKAATRIFQLLGHVAELPLIPAQVQAQLKGLAEVDPDDLPPEDEQKAYGREVTLPCFFDAVSLARIAGASSIRQDLGEAAAFFQDIAIAKAADPTRFGELKTGGAKEWGALVLSNEALKALQTLPDGR